MSDGFKLVQAPTGDGSFTLRRTDLDEPYHSSRGAITESRHVFIGAGLAHWLQGRGESTASIRILEMGLGTGLNALLTCDFLRQHFPQLAVEYTALETIPLPWEQVDKLRYCEGMPDACAREFRLMHTCAWEMPQPIHDRFTLKKIKGSWNDALALSPVHLVYYDAFGPRVQPELWDAAAMAKLADRLLPGGIMVTYCAQGAFKRALKAAGLRVEALQGPPGKREMIRASKPG